MDRKFVAAQTVALLRLGISAQDVQRTLRWLERTLPANADPATWLPTEQDLGLTIDDAAVLDARTNWYLKRSVPKRFRQLLDARTVTNG